MPHEQKTVLIVEDEADTADHFGEMMRLKGLRVNKTYIFTDLKNTVDRLAQSA